ncbi:AcrR family transcriptional regulator [Arthrobacter ginsengisoli]|uniref:AcrR family transcriptional regulator n=1 Tax=Arthrobacter ginsengisoli TaxID=1356565 RepID=A0ABU1UGF2_9MICC|nr:helix-turn-helix domain-containing protein [Arthrobacter ginsengisoli]MDR7084269.1 AcrR family transcriptional regulator [Arthrobacter ginsengisoli]
MTTAENEEWAEPRRQVPVPPRTPAQRQSLREVQKQVTRERLIESAAEEFRSRGFNETTAENIASSAGASRATFYVYFRTKAEIVAELMRRSQSDVMAAYRRLDDMEAPDQAGILDWLDETIMLWRERASDFNTMEQALANDDLVTETWLTILGDTYKVMPKTFARYTDPVQHERARLHLLTLQMALDRTMFFTILRGRPLDMELLKDVLAMQWLAFVRGDAAAG